MLPRERRIPRRLFGLLKAEKTAYSNDLFFIKIGSYQGKTARFCVSVSKKTAKKAVLRNKIRRFGYRAIQNLAIIDKPILVLIIFKKIPLSLDQTINLFTSAFRKIKII